MNKHKLNTPQTKNYPTLSSTAGKAWASALERLSRKYGWNSSGRKQQAAGFTIIEVVLVLAIASLIFLMVFVALPALQRNQRDIQRKNDLSLVLSAARNFQSNNRGELPANWNVFLRNSYLIPNEGDIFVDPDGSGYVFYGEHPIGTLPTDMKWQGSDYRRGDTVIYTSKGARCNGGNTAPQSGANSFALSIVLEGGGVYCLNN